MRKILNEEEERELKLLKEWCESIISFIEETDIHTTNSKMIYLAAKNIIVQTFNSKDLKGMRIIARDQSEWAKGLEENEVKKLNYLLQNKFGRDLTSL